MIRLPRYSRMTFAAPVLSFALFLSACGNAKRKEQLERASDMIYVAPSQPVLATDELAGFYRQDRAAYRKTFNDSSIFITGNIQYVDEGHGEVLLENNSGIDIVCLVDSATAQLLRKPDKVLFKGTCKYVGGDNLILIRGCALARIKK